MPPTGGQGFASRAIDSLRDRGFRWFFLAMLAQNAAMNMQWLVRGFIVFELTGSFAALGLMQLANAIPGFVLSLPAGVVADRMPRKYIVQAGQIVNMVLAFVIGALLFTDSLTFTHLLIAAVIQGASMAVSMPARQAMIPEVVGMDRMMNAVALNQAGMNVMRLAAPGVGGLLVAVLGVDFVYFLMGTLYLLAMVTLIRVPTQSALEMDGRRRGSRGGFIEGLRYLRGDRTMLVLLGTSLTIAAMSMPYSRLLPGFVSDVMDGGATELGILMSVTGIGSLVTSLVIASLPPKRRGALWLFSALGLGVGLLAFSASNSLVIALPVMVLLGAAQSGRMSLGNVLVQAYVDDDYRGRVMSIYMMERSMIAFSAFAVGLAASAFGVQAAFGALAVVVIAIALSALAFVPRIARLD